MKNWHLILIGVIIMLFSSCYTPKKAGQQTHRALDKYPEQTAGILRQAFPCVNGVVKPGDSTGYNKLRDSIAAISDFYMALINGIEPERIITKDLSDSMKVAILTENLSKCNERDRLREKQLSELKAKVSKPVFIHDTIPVKDMADVFIVEAERDKQVKANVKLQGQNDELTSKLGNSRKENWIWRIIALILAIIMVAKRFL